jgi:S1-C subfamily serine protease
MFNSKYLKYLVWLALALSQVPVNADEKPADITVKVQSRWGGLTALGPDTLADLAENIAPSVVNIDVAPYGQDYRNGKLPQKQSERFYRYYGVEPPQQNNPARTTGSGVILQPDGIIMTSNHVVERSDRIKVTLHDGRTYMARVIGSDSFSDLAVLKIEATNLPTARFGTAKTVRPGDWVLAIGSPLGLDHTVTLGIVSALGREAKGLDSFGARSGAVRFIQTDAAINPGNSGGPLVNLKGEVVGLNTFIRGDAQNIGFAIPADIAAEVANRLMHQQPIPHPFIGIVMEEREDNELVSDGRKFNHGVEVRTVTASSPAAKAGLMPGDIITEVEEKSVSRPGEVSEIVRKADIGDYLTMIIKRSGQLRTITVRVEQLPAGSDLE